MAETQIELTQVGPLVSLQDPGRVGGLRFGVSPSGPMDRLAFAAAHAALGNRLDDTAIEVSLGGIGLRAGSMPVTLAVTGAGFELSLDGAKAQANQVLTLHPGQTLSVRGGAFGSWAYVAFAGRVEAPSWMGSTARHSMSGLGSPALEAGRTLTLHNPEVRPMREGVLPAPARDEAPFRVVLGPQDHHFTPTTAQTFLTSDYKISPAFDRMGMRLDGPALPPVAALSIPSEPVLRGAVQVAGNGTPTVLLADHQSTGGYPKIATVLSCETDRLAQCCAGDLVQFEAIEPSAALAFVREQTAQRAQYLSTLKEPRGSLEERLMRENLIHGAPLDSFD